TVTVGAGTDGTAELSFSPGRIDPTNEAWTSSRKPLAGEFVFNGAKVIVVANHFNSKGGDQSSEGRFQPPNRTSEIQRSKQAVVLNGFVKQVLVADPQASIVLAGDFNDYQFSAPIATLTDDAATLTDLIDTLPVNERYTYNFNGISQVLDHIFVSKPLADVEYDVIHVNSEFADQASDHDPQVVRVRPAVKPELQGTVALDPSSLVQGSTTPVQITLSGWDRAKALTVALDGVDVGVVETDDAGAAATSIVLPAATTVGPHTVTVTTQRQTTAAAVLTITAPPPAVKRGVVVAVPIVRAGSPVAVLAAGWSPNIELAISLDGGTTLKNVTTDRYGLAAFNVTVPAATLPGVHRVVATATDGTNNSAPVLVLRKR
ncbi:MAG: endonuclease/exonuclease/phosphatase family protein, partial [Ilumatobacteraceae bacterium]